MQGCYNVKHLALLMPLFQSKYYFSGFVPPFSMRGDYKAIEWLHITVAIEVHLIAICHFAHQISNQFRAFL